MTHIRFILACCAFLSVSVTATSGVCAPSPAIEGKQKVSAFVRVKDEIQTVNATLSSIDGLFDRIVLIHSNEKDDGSIAFMNEWCAARPYCEIHEYPHVVYPSLTDAYRKEIPMENTMAAYGNFGVEKFEPEEWIVNIDADQVYIREKLATLVERIRTESPENEKTMYCMRGYNTFSWNDVLVKVRYQPIMGTYCDHYAIKRKMLQAYEPFYVQFVIKPKPDVTRIHMPGMHWFHFKKVLKDVGVAFDKDSVEEKTVTYLTGDEINQYIRHIAPYFPPDSPYSLYNMTLFERP